MWCLVLEATSLLALKSARSLERFVLQFPKFKFYRLLDYQHATFIIQMVGVWLVSQWQRAGQFRKFRLVELGPGRGTLMDDIIRVCARVCQA
jgi:hypothetical protein